MLLTRLAAVVLCLVTLPAIAQYSVDKVVIQGGAPYTDAELLDVAGLHAGQMLTRSSLQMAAQQLLDTGVFDDAEVSVSGQGKGRTVHFALKTTPLAKMMRASFANLVWWTPEELESGIHARVPLYRGRMADAGNLPDSVQDALVQMLAAKGVTATISHATVEPTSGHPVRVVDFRVETPTVRLQSAAVSGVPAGLMADVNRVTTRMAGSSYNEGLSGDTLEDRLLAPLRGAGYVAAALDGVKREVSFVGEKVVVAYSAQVRPGEVYTVSSVAWNATPLFSAEDFAKVVKLKAGDTASDSALQMAKQKIVAAYRAKGYLDAFVEPGAKLDDAAHTVSYELKVNAGVQYRLRSVTPVNLSAEARRDFDAGWRMKPGDVYDEGYVATFLTNNTALKNLAGYTAGFRAAADPQTHQVDLTINFVGRRRS